VGKALTAQETLKAKLDLLAECLNMNVCTVGQCQNVTLSSTGSLMGIRLKNVCLITPFTGVFRSHLRPSPSPTHFLLLYKTEPVPEKNAPHTVFIITNEIPRQTEIKLTERKGFSMVCLMDKSGSKGLRYLSFVIPLWIGQQGSF
jgi:hypothetical protein